MIVNKLTRFANGSRKPITYVCIRQYNPAERLPLTPDEKRKYPQVEQEFTDEGFPILRFASNKKPIFNERPPRLTRRRARFVAYNREESMKENQDWPSIWPTAKSFVPSAVPLPLRQSYEKKIGAVSRGKYANTELLKIPNFLHLTPGAIKRHCLAIKKFCTQWPEGLDTDEEVRTHFPVTFVTNDYVHASPNIRDPRSRIVQLKVHLDDLNLNTDDRRKLVELARHRYDKSTGILTIETTACPTRVQNKEYSEYLLSAVYFESQDHQDWEKEYFDQEAIHKIDLDDYRQKVERRLGLK